MSLSPAHIVTRAEWGAREPRSKTEIGPGVRGIAVHYSAAAPDEQDHHRNCAGRVRGIQNFHMDAPDHHWNDIAYNFLVCRHGFLFVGRGWGVRSAAQGTNDGNQKFHAVCFLGNDRDGRDDVTDLGRTAFEHVFRIGKLRYSRAREIRPHSFFHSTKCPGDELRRFIAHHHGL